ncbi:undecaprenyldiphospho-muramoylpentapeptide beta-N-acetylglucosaminyltransferase [Patescibacteria group bacterium]|nr:undecaprenyldiphospho-muramoylpentapeptide beta-N-acetylglucosaminyltransferase [Patescibacteria group bacterium]
MKIMFTGGGTGGHFYPIIAVAESIKKIVKEKRLLPPALYYMANEPYDRRALFDAGITFVSMPSGKIRRYFSLLNVTDVFKTAAGVLKSLWKIFLIYPDVIFGKGGYASFPALVAARIFRIPVVIHESDSVPGRVNVWAGKFAVSVAVSFPEAAKYFPEEKTAFTGNPVRQEVLNLDPDAAYEYFKMEKNVPTIFVIGGSQGARIINETLLSVLAELVKKYQVIHQTGSKNFDDVSKEAGVILSGSPLKTRYLPIAYLDDVQMKSAAAAASLVVSRAGSTIFELAAWGVPSIVIPLREAAEDHQTKNAFNYARSGAAVVIEEVNLSPHVLLSEIDRLLGDSAKLAQMKTAARQFARLDAADTIALKLLEIGLSHEV